MSAEGVYIWVYVYGGIRGIRLMAVYVVYACGGIHVVYACWCTWSTHDGGIRGIPILRYMWYTHYGCICGICMMDVYVIYVCERGIRMWRCMWYMHVEVYVVCTCGGVHGIRMCKTIT